MGIVAFMRKLLSQKMAQNCAVPATEESITRTLNRDFATSDGLKCKACNGSNLVTDRELCEACIQSIAGMNIDLYNKLMDKAMEEEGSDGNASY